MSRLLVACTAVVLASSSSGSSPRHVRRRDAVTGAAGRCASSVSAELKLDDLGTFSRVGAWPSVNTNLSLWPWPRAASLSFGPSTLPINASTFAFVLAGGPPSPPPANGSMAVDILLAAFSRTYATIFGAGAGGSDGARAGGQASAPSPADPPPSLSSLVVKLRSLDDTLQLFADESYSLSVVGAGAGALSCNCVYGCLRGLETFSQAVVRLGPGFFAVTGYPLSIQGDAPRFPHRGLMLDASRHFLPLTALLSAVDALSYERSNTLHLHLTDVQSFPYASEALPELARGGAWDPEVAVYTMADLRALSLYAKYRGVRVIPELDTPAHSLSWGAGRPDLLLPECAERGNAYGSVLDPTTNATYDAIAALVGELRSVFPDAVFFSGGDEVDVGANTSCYSFSAKVAQWMEGMGMEKGDWKAVARYHLSRVQNIVLGGAAAPPPPPTPPPTPPHSAGGAPPPPTMLQALWEDALDHLGPGDSNPTPPPPEIVPSRTIVHTWFCPCWSWWNASAFADAGFFVVKADDWYLDSLAEDWSSMYTKDPLTNAASCDYSAGWANCTCGMPADSFGCFNITAPAEVAKVLGGESSMWGERADAANLFPTVWPRASAVAERLWSDQSLNDPARAQPRLMDHICRLKGRGVAAGPVAPDYCDGSRR